MRSKVGENRRPPTSKVVRDSGKPDAKLHGIFTELVMDREETGILSFCRHAGIVLPSDGDAWWPTFQAHYRDGEAIDHGRVCRDLATWGPIASRVVEIQLEARRHG